MLSKVLYLPDLILQQPKYFAGPCKLKFVAPVKTIKKVSLEPLEYYEQPALHN